jgi:hypothetical protein
MRIPLGVNFFAFHFPRPLAGIPRVAGAAVVDHGLVGRWFSSVKGHRNSSCGYFSKVIP